MPRFPESNFSRRAAKTQRRSFWQHPGFSLSSLPLYMMPFCKYENDEGQLRTAVATMLPSPWLCAFVRAPVFQNGRDGRSNLFAALDLCVRNWVGGDGAFAPEVRVRSASRPYQLFRFAWICVNRGSLPNSRGLPLLHQIFSLALCLRVSPLIGIR